jgi:glycosyltransferase involved in cell wall biosynthesis
MKISATIITLTEERNIARAVESLRCCDEILVVDSGSADGTLDIARKLGARVIETGWRGYAKQKNFAAAEAEQDWIFSLDADEALSEALEGEIWEIKNNGPRFDGYTMPRLAQYCGRWIRHSGWYPDRKLRLYHRAKAAWVGEYVHESVVMHSGEVGALEGEILHFTCASVSEHLKTLDRYTTLAAQEVAARGAGIPIGRLLIDPAWTFVRTYFVHRGFLDGAEGASIAWMAALYTYLKYAKARQMR